MIKHIVMFRFKELVDGKKKEEIIEEALGLLKDFDRKIPQIQAFQAVMNAQEAPESNYDIALICEFADKEDLDAYQAHPEHVKFGEYISKVKESRACIDFTC